MTEAEELLDQLDAELATLLAEREADVVSWRRATPLATLHVPEPLWVERQLPAIGAGELLDGDAADPYGQAPSYGLDANGRVIFRRGRDRFMKLGDTGLWFASDGSVVRMGSRGMLAEQSGRAIESTEYIYDSGRMVEARTTTVMRNRKDCGVTRESRWFRYDHDRLILVIWVVGYSNGQPYPRAQRLQWSSAGDLMLVTETYGDARVDGSASGDELLAAALEWEQGPDVARSVTFDARIHTVESDIPPLDEVLEDLHTTLGDAIERAVESAVAAATVPRPLLMLVSPGFPLQVQLVDESVRGRRRELAFEVSEFPFFEAVELPLLDYLDEGTLRRCRQAAQSGATRDSRRLTWAPPDRTELERQIRFQQRQEVAWRALSADLNKRRFSGAAPDFVAAVRGSGDPWQLAEETLGAARVDAFRASLRPAATKLPRGPGSLSDRDDVMRLLRSRGVGERFVERLADLAEWGFRLVPDGGSSRIGGQPELPVGTDWPTFDGRPLNFIAQVELGELAAAPGREVLPDSGRLLFFFAVDEESFEPANAGPDDRARITFVPPGVPTTVATSPADIAAYAPRSVVHVPRLTLPSPGPSIAALGLDHYELQAYTAAWDRSLEVKGEPPTHRHHDQLLGHPTPIQEDPRLTPDDQSKDWKLVLAVHDDASIGLHLADAGALYFMMPLDALARGAWNLAFVDAQSC